MPHIDGVEWGEIAVWCKNVAGLGKAIACLQAQGYALCKIDDNAWYMVAPERYRCLHCHKEITPCNIDVPTRCCEHCGIQLHEKSGGRSRRFYQFFFTLSGVEYDRFATVARSVTVYVPPPVQ